MKTLIFDAVVKRHYRVSLLRDEDTLLYHIIVEQLRKDKYKVVERSESFSHDRAFKDFYMFICIYNRVKFNYYGKS